MDKKTTSFIDDENVINAAHKKAKVNGLNLSTVIRLLLRMWLNGDVTISAVREGTQ